MRILPIHGDNGAGQVRGRRATLPPLHRPLKEKRTGEQELCRWIRQLERALRRKT